MAEPQGPSRVDWRQGTARPGETRVRLSEMVTGLIAAGGRAAAHGGSIMPQWHAPCWRRILPCPGCPRAAYCAASFIWFCLSQWPLFRDLARSGRQGQSEAAQNKSCFAVLSCFPVLFLFCFWPARRLSPRKMLRPLTRSFFQPRKTRTLSHEVNEIAIQNLLFGL